MFNTQSAFSLLELLVVLAIVGILLMFGVPAFQDMVRNNRITTATNMVVAQLNYARSEAIRLNWAVNLESLSTDTDVWTQGWLIYRDADSKSAGGTAYIAASDQLLRQRDAFDGELVIRSSGVSDSIVPFAPNGTLAQPAPVNFTVCDGRGAAYGRRVILERTGHSAAGHTENC